MPFFQSLLSCMFWFPYQAKYDFVNDLTCLDAVKGEEEISRFKNECLGMAVLHLSYTALQTGSSLQDVAKQTRCGLQFSLLFRGRSESCFKEEVQ